MEAWLTIPSARPPAEVRQCIAAWHAQGYKVALLRNNADQTRVGADVEIIVPQNEYPGYGASCNKLIHILMRAHVHAQWFVCAGDDTFPDPKHSAQEIAAQCWHRFCFFNSETERFPGLRDSDCSGIVPIATSVATFGVMQPTGDRFANGSIDKIAGSPWIGREFARRVRSGSGPYDPSYRHMFVDEWLMNVAERLGVFWRRPDLVHLHRHFQRESDDLHSRAVARPVPPHLVEANSPKHWDEARALFFRHRADGFREGVTLLP